MQKQFIKCSILVVIGLLFFNSGYAVFAKDVFQQSDQGNIYTFKDLGYSERIMLGPYDTERMQFSLPPTWNLSASTKITLRYSFTSNNVNTGTVFSEGNLGGMLIVSFNNIVIDTIMLENNTPSMVEITIPADALRPTSGNGRYSLSFFLDASFDCDEYTQSALIIAENSTVDFQYSEIDPVLDLSLFPRPLYQPDPLVPINTVMVVPANASKAEIQAALSASAGLGSITNGEMVIPLLAEDVLTQTLLEANNVIFVGTPSKLQLLDSINFLTPFIGGKVVINGAVDDDGIIQMAISPWNPARVVYFVGGNNDAAVLKAGQTLGTGYLISSGRPHISVIRSVNHDAVPSLISENQTFADLGYENQLIGVGESQYLTYNFFASAEQAASADGYLDVVTSRSDLIDYERSGVVVYVNGEFLGNLDFSEPSEDQITTTRMKFLPGVLNRGVNIIEIVGNLIPYDRCVYQDFVDSSMTVAESSLIHLPSASTIGGVGSGLLLDNFPTMFLTQKDLGDLSFVVSKDDPASWDYASRIAYYIGYRGGVSLPGLNVSFGDDVPAEIRDADNMIIVGRASLLPIVSELSDVMPAPFDAVTDEAIQPTMMVDYRLLPGVNVGYLELFESPWNSERAILGVMANSSDGLPYAGNMLVQEDSVELLGGNFAIIYGEQILSTDTRLGVSRDGLVSELPVAVTVTPSNNNDPNTDDGTITPPEVIDRPGWILPTLIFLVLVTLGVAGYLIYRTFFAEAKKAGTESDKKEK